MELAFWAFVSPSVQLPRLTGLDGAINLLAQWTCWRVGVAANVRLANRADLSAQMAVWCS